MATGTIKQACNISAGSIAIIESSPATQAHAKGEYIVYNGQLYKVTAAISAGESLTVGTNVEAANICNAVGAYTSEVLATYAYATILIAYNMTTKICFLSVRGTSTVFPQQEVTINLPNYIVPKIGVLTVGHNGCSYVDVRTSGSVAIAGANKAYAFCTAIFPIN